SRAIFGRATWHATDKLDFVVGGRYTEDEKRGVISPVMGALVDEDGDISNGVNPPPNDRTVSFNKFTYEGTATYKITSDINVFARYATAYVPGGLLRNVPYQPETTKSVEAGVKSDWFGRKLRLNLTGFHQESENLQIQQNKPPFGALV